jgi:quinol monooxygenase YgiN
MAGFVQIIEFQTSRVDEMQALAEQRRAELAAETAPHRVTWTADRDRPGFYLVIAEFESYEVAMANSSRPEVSEFSAELGKLCEAPPKFYNLDVVASW